MFQGLQMIVLIIVWLCSTALLVIVKTLFPKVVQDVRDVAEESPGRSFWIGFVNGAFLFALTILFISFLVEKTGIQFIGIPALIIDSISIVGAILGFAGMSLLIGDRLFPSHTPFKKKSYAAGITLLACMTPIFGWYVLLPYLLLVGFGALLINAYRGFRASRKKEVENVN